MSLSVQQLLSDARRLSSRLRDHDSLADGVIASSQDLLKGIEAMKEYNEDVDGLNSVAHNRPRAQLVLGIQQENRHIRQLQHENKELRAALEESHNAVELIMSKYRQHVSYLVNTTKLDKNLINYQRTRMLQEKTDKICDMARVMKTAIQWDNEANVVHKERLTRLATENKGLRDLLEISRRSGSIVNPIARPKLVSRECQTDELEGDPTTSKLCFNNANRVSGGSYSVPTKSTSVGTSAGMASTHPSSPLARTSAVSPVHARPLSSASSVSGASDASSPTSSVIMSSSWQEEEVEDMDLSPSPSSNGEAVRNRELSESEESEDEVTFNTIKRGATVNSMSPPQQQQTKQNVVECQTEEGEGGKKKQNGIKRVGIPLEGEKETKNGVREGNKCNIKVPDGDDTIVDDEGGGGGLVNGETEMEEGRDSRLRISDSPEKTSNAVGESSSASNNESDSISSKDGSGSGDSLTPQTDQRDS